jgi:hypothetical protein
METAVRFQGCRQQRQQKATLTAALLAGLIVVGCSGAVGGTADNQGDSSSETPDEVAGPGIPGSKGKPKNLVGSLLLRRLSRDEYDRTMRDLLGDTSRPGRALPVDTRDTTFASPGVTGVTEVNVFLGASTTVADAAVAKGAKTFGCDVAADGCFSGWLPGFAKRAYRRPVSAEEISALQGLYTKARGELKFTAPQAASFVMQAVLNSPWFLYHWELGDRPARSTGSGEAEAVALTGYERASRLSYFLWGSMPDETLFTAAESGALESPTEMVKQARRLLADPKAKEALVAFHRQWLALLEASSDGADAFAAAASGETSAFVDYVFGEGGGKLETLLTSNLVFANEALAPAYGLKDVTGTQFARREISQAQRFGILTQANFLAAHGAGADSHPVKRGVQIVKKLLCQDLPPPPAVVEPVPAAAPGLSTRERYAAHQKNECATACHGLIDPAGFAFEHYDGTGRFRTADGGKPVDASGTIDLPGGGETKFTSIADLSVKLAKDAGVRSCITSQWASFALGRPASDDEAGSINTAYKTFADSGYDLRELLVALTSTKTFLNRKPATGEVLQ